MATATPTPTTTPVAVSDGQLADVADMVRRICVGRLGVDDGLDTAQDVMSQLWRAVQRPDFRPDGLHPYAATVARYAVMRAYGERDRHRHRQLGDAAEHVVADPAPGPAEQVEQAEERAEERAAAAATVAGLLARLSDRHLQVVTVSMATGWDTAAAAEVLGISASGVRSAQVRAMAELRAAAGVASRNPLASGIEENARRRRRRAAAARRRVPEPGVGVQEVLDVFAA